MNNPTQEAANKEAIEKYPPIQVGNYMLHIFEQNGMWEVWLNVEREPFTGWCVGTSRTSREDALAHARRVLGEVVNYLQTA